MADLTSFIFKLKLFLKTYFKLYLPFNRPINSETQVKKCDWTGRLRNCHLTRGTGNSNNLGQGKVEILIKLQEYGYVSWSS